MGEGYHTLATMEDPEAAFALYWAYAKGNGVKRDRDRAMELLRTSAEAGHAPAQAQLGREIYGKSKDEALRWYLAAAAQGNADGQHGAGRMLFSGRYVARDEARGLALLAAAAAQGGEDAVREHARAVRQVEAQARSDEENLARAIAEHGLDAHADVVRALARPSVRLVASRADDAAIPVGATKIGGAPDLPADFAWPTRAGRRLAFVAQIAFAQLRRLAPVTPELPSDGLLWFFYDAEQQPWGSRDESDGWHVAGQVGTETLVRHPDAPAFPACAIDMFVELTLPPIRSALARSLGEAFDRYTDLHESFTYIYRRPPRVDGQVHRVGGHPDAIQGDMTRRIEYGWRGADLDHPTDELEAAARTWRLLLQLDSDDAAGMMWGDSGRLFVWMREDDLRTGRWHDARLQLQCS